MPPDPRERDASRPRSARVVLLGAPGAGKGTQAAVLSERLDVSHVATGAVLRQRAQTDPTLAARLDKGDLVPDDVVLDVVRDALGPPSERRGYVLDGFPRTLTQAQALDEIAPPDLVVYLEIPDEVARRRLARRADGRGDDREDRSIQRRLELFHTQTEPVRDYYSRNGVMTTVDAAQSPDAVTADIARSLDALPPR